MSPSRHSDSKSSWFLIRYLLKTHIFTRWRPLSLGVISLGVNAATTAFLAKSLKPIVDDIFIGHRQDLLVYVALSVFFIFLTKGICEYVAAVCLESVSQNMARELREKLFSHLIFLEVKFFRKRHEATLSSALMNDIQIVQDGMLQIISGIGRDLVMVFALTSVMMQENFFLWGVSIIGVPLLAIPLVYCSRKIRSLSLTIQKNVGTLNSFFQQIFQNITLVKASCTQNQEIQHLHQTLSIIQCQNLKVCRLQGLLHPFVETLAGIAISVIIFYGGSKVIQGSQTTGGFMAFITALLLIYRPLKNLLQFNARLQIGLAALQRFFNILDIPPVQEEVGIITSFTDLTVFQQDISIQNLSFSYQEDPEDPGIPVFKDFSCTFHKQRFNALVGPSGAGKSTLFQLLLKFYYSTQGNILMGNRDLQNISADELRQNIAFVGQEISLFDQTVSENIRYGMPDASLGDVQDAAKRAYAHEFIMELPGQYHTPVGPHGLKLSGGQRQRIALARAFLKQAPILLLDEATSALDTVCERQIQDALARLSRGKTTIAIAHRLSTIQKADCIFVLDKGQLVESGSHEKLLEAQQLYWSLWQKDKQSM